MEEAAAIGATAVTAGNAKSSGEESLQKLPLSMQGDQSMEVAARIAATVTAAGSSTTNKNGPGDEAALRSSPGPMQPSSPTSTADASDEVMSRDSSSSEVGRPSSSSKDEMDVSSTVVSTRTSQHQTDISLTPTTTNIDNSGNDHLLALAAIAAAAQPQPDDSHHDDSHYHDETTINDTSTTTSAAAIAMIDTYRSLEGHLAQSSSSSKQPQQEAHPPTTRRQQQQHRQDQQQQQQHQALHRVHSSSLSCSSSSASNDNDNNNNNNETILTNSTNCKQQPPLPAVKRRGKWTAEEEAYVARVIQEFNSGYLPALPGTTLRSYLSETLQCDPMRITKKFTGEACIGKRVFHPAVRTAANAVAMDAAQTELLQLEQRWRRRLELQQRESAKKAAAVVVASAHHGVVLTSGGGAVAPIGEVDDVDAAAEGVGGAAGGATGHIQSVTQTASWLDRAKLALQNSSNQHHHHATLQDVERLIDEGPLIQQNAVELLSNMMSQDTSDATMTTPTTPPPPPPTLTTTSSDSHSKRMRRDEDAQALVGFLRTVQQQHAAGGCCGEQA
jgi:hypothetical protein